jgi:hypothetical protein
MACNTIRGFTYDACTPNIGGIKNIWLANYVENAATITIKNTSEGSTLVDGAVSGFAEGVTWTKYPMRKNTCSMTSTLNNSTDGASYVTTELAMVFSKMEAQKRIAIQALAIGECMAVVEDSNGEMWFLGADAALTATAGGGETGTAKGDANRYTLTLTDESLGMPYTLDESVKATIKETPKSE